MKNITQYFLALVFTLILGISAFASVKNFQSFEQIELTNYEFNEVPKAMFDQNFRWWQPQNSVEVIPANINDIMMTDGFRIYYNPAVVNQTPAKVVAFFLAHEYGHIIGRTSSEFQSDQFAARIYAQTDIGVVKAAIWHFYNIQGNMCNNTHGCGWQRSINIGQTAGFSEAEIGEIIRGNF